MFVEKLLCGAYSFNCPCGSFPSICHNEVRDLTAGLLSEVCCDVGIEPALQPLECEPPYFATAKKEDGAHLDVVARDFWVQIGSMNSLMLGCLIHLCAPIFVLSAM